MLYDVYLLSSIVLGLCLAHLTLSCAGSQVPERKEYNYMDQRPVRIRLVDPDQELTSPTDDPVTTAKVHIIVEGRDGHEWEAPSLAEALVHFLSEDGHQLIIQSHDHRVERRENDHDREDSEAGGLIILRRDDEGFEALHAGLSGVGDPEHSIHHDWTRSSVLELTGNVGLVVKEYMLPKAN